MTPEQWNTIRWFREREFRCRHCQAEGMDYEFMQKLDLLRAEMGFPFIVSSGFRCAEYNLAYTKSLYGPHTEGRAVDLLIEGERAYFLVAEAIRRRFTGIGLYQKGSGTRYVHLDIAQHSTRPRIWTY